MQDVIIGVDPHKLSATIEVVDHNEQLLGFGRFGTDRACYAAMRTYVECLATAVWAIEGRQGCRASVAQRLVEAGEEVLDVPAKLAARVRLFDTGHNRKTDALDAHSIAVVAVRTADLRVVGPTVSSRRCGCSPTAVTSLPGTGPDREPAPAAALRADPWATQEGPLRPAGQGDARFDSPA
jgi:hypothetical protein